MKLLRIDTNFNEDLTERELEILELMAQGLANKEISKKLFISYKTVKNHISHIYNKLNINCDRQAIAYFHEKIQGEGSIE